MSIDLGIGVTEKLLHDLDVFIVGGEKRIKRAPKSLLRNAPGNAETFDQRLNAVLQASYDWNSQNAQCLANQSSGYTAERRRKKGNSRITPI